MRCRLCREFYADHPTGSPVEAAPAVRCAFEAGEEFDEDNAGCLTLMAVRGLAADPAATTLSVGSDTALIVPYRGPDGRAASVVLVWHKDRVKTDVGVVMSVGRPASDRPLDRETAERLVSEKYKPEET